MLKFINQPRITNYKTLNVDEKERKQSEWKQKIPNHNSNVISSSVSSSPASYHHFDLKFTISVDSKRNKLNEDVIKLKGHKANFNSILFNFQQFSFRFFFPTFSSTIQMDGNNAIFTFCWFRFTFCGVLCCVCEWVLFPIVIKTNRFVCCRCFLFAFYVWNGAQWALYTHTHTFQRSTRQVCHQVRFCSTLLIKTIIDWEIFAKK